MESFSPNPPPTSAEPTHPELLLACKRLRNTIHCLAISVIILTGTVFIFILREIVMVRAQTKRSIAYIHEFRESNLPSVMQQLQKDLIEFAEKNPDFRPILARYGQPPRASGGVEPGTKAATPAATPKTTP